MLNKMIYLLLLLGTPLSGTCLTTPIFEVGRRLVEQDCLFVIDNPLKDKLLLSANPLENSTPSITTVRFDAVVSLNDKRYGAKLLFECARGPLETLPKSPGAQIDEENSGGRYFRHVAWERDYDGASWKGKLAYVDYIFGDGQQNKVHQYLICRAPDYRACFNIEISLRAEPTARGLGKR